MAEPVSWLLLERYALGELDDDERRAVELRLAESPEDRACLDAILSDRSELPALPLPLPAPPVRTWAPVAALAAAAALFLMLRPSELPAARRAISDGTKGGEVAILLVSDRHGEAPTSFGAGERFKLLVTCPPWFDKRLHPIVFQAGARYEPLPAAHIECGNHVSWPGAFSLDGPDPATVCLTWGPELDDEAVCTQLQPR